MTPETEAEHTHQWESYFAGRGDRTRVACATCHEERGSAVQRDAHVARCSKTQPISPPPSPTPDWRICFCRFDADCPEHGVEAEAATPPPEPLDRTNCRFPRWDAYDRGWVCCHGGGHCGGCAKYPENCTPSPTPPDTRSVGGDVGGKTAQRLEASRFISVWRLPDD